MTIGGGGGGCAQHEGAHVGAHEAAQFAPHVGLGAIGANGMNGRFLIQQPGVQLGAHVCEHGDGQLRTGGGGMIGPTWTPVQQFGVQAGAHDGAHDGPHGPAGAGGAIIGAVIGGGAGGNNSSCCVKPGKQHCGVQAGAHALLQPRGQDCGGGIGGSIGGSAISPQQLGAHEGAHDAGHGAGQAVNIGGAAICETQQSLLHDGKHWLEHAPEHVPPETGLDRDGW